MNELSELHSLKRSTFQMDHQHVLNLHIQHALRYHRNLKISGPNQSDSHLVAPSCHQGAGRGATSHRVLPSYCLGSTCRSSCSFTSTNNWSGLDRSWVLLSSLDPKLRADYEERPTVTNGCGCRGTRKFPQNKERWSICVTIEMKLPNTLTQTKAESFWNVPLANPEESSFGSRPMKCNPLKIPSAFTVTPVTRLLAVQPHGRSANVIDESAQSPVNNWWNQVKDPSGVSIPGQAHEQKATSCPGPCNLQEFLHIYPIINDIDHGSSSQQQPAAASSKKEKLSSVIMSLSSIVVHGFRSGFHRSSPAPITQLNY